MFMTKDNPRIHFSAIAPTDKYILNNFNLYKSKRAIAVIGQKYVFVVRRRDFETHGDHDLFGESDEM